MPRYYNRTRGILTVSLADGSPMTVGAKSWVDFAPGDDTTGSVIAAVTRGDLVRSPLPDPPPVEAEAPADAPEDVKPEAKEAKPSKDPEPLPGPPMLKKKAEDTLPLDSMDKRPKKDA